MSAEYKINLSFKDCMAILFRRNKRCPLCSIAVTRVTKRTPIDKGNVIERKGHNIDIGHQHKQYVTVSYVCNECEKSFLPREFW